MWDTKKYEEGRNLHGGACGAITVATGRDGGPCTARDGVGGHYAAPGGSGGLRGDGGGSGGAAVGHTRLVVVAESGWPVAGCEEMVAEGGRFVAVAGLV
jgi:hypothetical protein